jgi:cell wall-associated NlpC family hydrolase
MGRVKGVGVDCGGLLYEIYGPHFGPFAPFPTYAPDWACHKDDELYLDFIKPYVREVPIPIRGGIGLFHIGQAYAHAAIYVGENQFIHAWGRLRAGSVTKTPMRVMQSFCKDHSPKYFDLAQPCKS